MKNELIHDKKDKHDLLKNYYFALLPLILFSIYKNGIHLVVNDLVNISSVFSIIYFYLISIAIGFIISKIWKEKPVENILVCLILACSISINTNMIIYPISLFVLLFIAKYIREKTRLKINTLSLVRFGLILSLLVNSYSYMNIAEKLNKFDYNMFDYFLGYSVGGLGTTSLAILIISFIILAMNKFYKKVIPLTASLSFVITSLIIMFITKSNDFSLLLNGTVYFSFVFIATDFYSTPYEKKSMAIYGLLIGILSSILVSLNLYYEAGYLSILILSIFVPFLNKITNRKYLK